ncbi:MAG: hypothetical protein D6681_09405 [Calditrichaeota bacterium]|nr:MAG: hypothetical protein D6681_09405 [Calditrichota bacterium]
MNGKLMGAMGGVFLCLTVVAYAQTLTQVGFVTANAPALGVKVQGNYLYFAEPGSPSGVFRSVDVSDPANPVALASFATPGLIIDVWVQETFQGAFAFLGMADNEAGIRVMDVSNPPVPIPFGGMEPMTTEHPYPPEFISIV